MFLKNAVTLRLKKILPLVVRAVISRCVNQRSKILIMDTIAVKEVKRTPKPAKEETVMPRRKRGLLGIWKGKVHYDDAIFNLD